MPEPDLPRASPDQPRARRPHTAPDWTAVRLFAMDVDGVLTDGTVQIHSNGTEAKSFSILDGLGLKELDRNGVITAWISGRPSVATSRRAEELRIPHLIMGRTDKLSVLQELAQRLALGRDQCAYMGDDTMDVPALEWAGVGIAPPGAIGAALAAANYVTQRTAGLGAVREVCDLILAAQMPTDAGRGRRSGSRTPRR